MGFSFSSTSGNSGTTNVTVSATSRSDSEDLVQNYILSNSSGNSLNMVVVQKGEQPVGKYITFKPSTFSFPSSGGSDSLQISSNDDWSVNFGSWITPNQLSGNGNTIIGISVGNNTGNTRNGVISGVCLSDSAKTAAASVSQSGSYVEPYLSVSPLKMAVNASGGTGLTFAVTSNQNWEAFSDARWVTINTLSGSGNGNITFGVSENASNIDREASIYVVSTASSLSATTVIEQASEKQYIMLNPYNFQVDASGSTGNVISVSANCDYNISADVNWITLSAASGSGNGSVSFTTAPSESKFGEVGNIEFSNSAVSSYATVEILSKNYLSANTSSLTASIDGDTLTANVYSDVSWVVSVEQNIESEISTPWLSVSPMSGSGNSLLRIIAASGTTAMSGRITLYNSKYDLSWIIGVERLNADL